MADEFDPPGYPDILTEKNWNKNKSLWAAIYGPTGVGELMKETRKEYDDVKWELFNFLQLLVPLGNDRQISDLDKFYAAAEKQLPQTKKVEAAAGRLEDLALATAKKFKVHALVPKGSTEHAAKVKLAAGKFRDAVGASAIKALLNRQYERGKNFIEDQQAELAKSFKAIFTAVADLEAKAKTVKALADFKKFYENHVEEVRKEWNTLDSVVEFTRENQRGWKRFCTRSAMPHEESNVAEAVENIVRVAQGFRDTVNEANKGK